MTRAPTIQTPEPETPRNVRWGERGFGFFFQGKLFLQRCGKCSRENYAPAAASGQCAWCGDKPGEDLKALLDAGAPGE